MTPPKTNPTKIYNWENGFLPDFYRKRVEIGSSVIDDDGDKITLVHFKYPDNYIKTCSILSKFLV